MTSSPQIQVILHASVAPEVRLPDGPALTLTRNFGWVVLFCAASLLTAPVVIAWTASFILK
jgi:hypothetical protein